VFEGHFPGYPLMPGVLLVETMAQSSGWLVVAVNKFERMPFLAAVKDAKFRTFVLPGQVLTVDARIEHDGSGYAVTSAKIASAGKPICDATLTLRVMPFPNDEIRQHMRAQATRLGVPSEEPAHG
jgi:3-hydroxyacyl-[acyl-carrier-protein] dehydratase